MYAKKGIREIAGINAEPDVQNKEIKVLYLWWRWKENISSYSAVLLGVIYI